ncbi:FLYWCH zinc finger domain-containing protein [Ditylenchus destructor]|uniref:FLYWCH zinc finger domain-containing protein n=1 Tax=Ditylenchus destructor TaxID=166010 RepID=A0AAD4MT52_9BILA|nr:FLYWCH zinc finger domain-containing protein [Ditylenchus destructor]
MSRDRPVIQAIQTLKTEKGNLKFVYESHEFWQYKTSKDHLKSFWRCAKFQKAACPCRIQTELGVCHPTVGNFILSLKKVQHGRDQQYMQWISGRRPKDKRKKYKDADKRILKILQEYQRNERTVIELLRGIAQNIVIDDVVGIDDEVENNE